VVFANLIQLRAGGLVIAADPLFSSRSKQLGELTVRHAVPLLSSCGYGREVAFGAGLQDEKLSAESARSGLQFRQLGLADRVTWIRKCQVT
jgi:hypothetical protein